MFNYCVIRGIHAISLGHLNLCRNRGKKADGDHRKLSESEKNLENSRSDSEKDVPKGSRLEKIPCMLSWTGTTNTSTTSSDRQR